MQVEQIAPGLWRWTGWRESIGAEVGCVYLEGEEGVVLIDPLVPPEDEARFLAALDRDVARAGGPGVHVLATSSRHERSGAALVSRYGGRLRSADEPPAGVAALETGAPGEVAFWLPGHGALVCGDVLRRDGERVVAGAASARFAADALGLGVRRLLLSHGGPVLERAEQALREALGPLLGA